jgi:hypothetical protein
VPHRSCGSSVPWCARADAMFNAEGMRVLDVRRGHRKLVITVETDVDVTGCPECGVLATGHGRRRVTAADAPCFGVAGAAGRLAAGRVPQGVPIDLQMPRQRRDRRVVVGERVRRSPGW